ncbi:MAG: hypothetical protein J7619_29695 [Dyadobacter sp.]|uniref:hypothetical protein n=1 Tax=Dyadobacter sp. TaxID=1914288 RepID=UPI001B2419D4|nr:hypothetical protein [Dyadobacter sp.]MBO9616897.1 hypothetical protein [Dyadobacter sp.]
MKNPQIQSDVTRGMLRHVIRAVGQLVDADFAQDFASEENAPLRQLLGIRAGAAETASTVATQRVSKWRDIVSQTGIEKLRGLFSESRIIPFSDWAEVDQAADVWYGLLADVIRPLARSDWEFIFYLGNPSSRHFFEVDEILDIMGSFTRSGNVTLALDAREAWAVWSVLFGRKEVSEFDMQDPEAKERYRALFQMLNVRRLIIYSESQAALAMEASYDEIARPPVPARFHHRHERDNFISGYALGLKMGIEPAQCLILGIATAGSTSGNEPTRVATQDFLYQWLDGVQS